jgi:hypothetical protein
VSWPGTYGSGANRLLLLLLLLLLLRLLLPLLVLLLARLAVLAVLRWRTAAVLAPAAAGSSVPCKGWQLGW